MSEKEINELIQTGELAKADPEAEPAAEAEVSEELLEAAEAHAEQQIAELKEKSRKRKKSLIKLGAMTLLSVIIFIFTTIAWFTMSREVESGSMAIKTSNELFSIQAMPSPYIVGIYDDSTQNTYVRDRLLSGASKTSDVITWTITEDVAETDPDTGKTTIIKGKNIGNGPAEDQSGGISPGSSGELHFIISPTDPVNAQFAYFMYGYSVEYNSDGDEDKSTIALIDDNASSERVIARDLINGHILLFKNYDPETHKYSGLISSDDEFNRIMTEVYTSETTVSVYWVWVETLAELVLDDSNDAHKRNLRGKKSLCSDQSETIEFLKNNPSWFLLDPENPNKTWTEFTSETIDTDVVTTINNNYNFYSSCYNEADQCIGTNVAYLLLDMNATGTAASTP